MNRRQIERLLAGLPPSAGETQRRRAETYARAARRAELEQALRGTGDHETTNGHGNGNGNGDGAADALIRLALELDALERVQPRVDSWLRITVAAASEDPGVAPFGEGPA